MPVFASFFDFAVLTNVNQRRRREKQVEPSAPLLVFFVYEN